MACAAAINSAALLIALLRLLYQPPLLASSHYLVASLLVGSLYLAIASYCAIQQRAGLPPMPPLGCAAAFPSWRVPT